MGLWPGIGTLGLDFKAVLRLPAHVREMYHGK